MSSISASILSQLEISRKELLDLGLRNSLLNYKVPASKGVHVVQEVSSAIFNLLVKQGKSFSFLSRSGKDGNSEELEFPELSLPELEVAHNDTKFQTSESDKKLQSRLLNTYYTAKTNIEEQGVNILFISLGMLIWYESANSNEEVSAPLVLIPVTLERSSASERFRLKYSSEDIGANISLIEKMKEFGLKIPELGDIDDFDINKYFQQVTLEINKLPKWRVEPDTIELGFFSFGKFMIYNDLDNGKWPVDKKPVDHLLLQSLFQSGFSEGVSSFNETTFIDNETNAEQLFQVVDADSSQILSLLEVRERKNLVIQGPPGTGKSQTITNIIADAVGQGKKVLFVAEKLAALDVVKRRLDNIGLGDVCLELHSQKANKKELHQELMRVIDQGKPKLDKLKQEVTLLEEYKNELNQYCDQINKEIGQSGLSTHKVIGLLLGIKKVIGDNEMSKFDIEDFDKWNQTKINRVEAFCEEIQARLNTIGVPSKLLFWGSGLKVFLELEGLDVVLRETIKATKLLIEFSEKITFEYSLVTQNKLTDFLKFQNFLHVLSLKPNLTYINIKSNVWITRKNDINELIEIGSKLTSLRARYKDILLPAAWDTDVAVMRRDLMQYGDKWYKFLISAYKKSNSQLAGLCSVPLPTDNFSKLSYINDLIESKRLEAELNEHSELARNAFGENWKNIKSDWSAFREISNYLSNLHKLIAAEKCPSEIFVALEGNERTEIITAKEKYITELLNAFELNKKQLFSMLKYDEFLSFGDGGLQNEILQNQLDLFENWQKRINEIHDLTSWNTLTEHIEIQGFSFLIKVATYWAKASQYLRVAFLKQWYDWLLQKAFNSFSSLRKFQRDSHEEIAKQFKRLDLLNLQYNRGRVALRHWEGLPNMQAGGQVNILRLEFNRKARFKPIRKLVEEAGQALQQIKPVFMMSPLSIANFLPPTSIDFDLVVFDEASQVKPVDALGAILRAKQVVVVGDTKQLPPSNFFESLVNSHDVEDDEGVTADMPSILSLCQSQGLQPKMLRWHYRSLHESLISFSNSKFYENRLVIFPSPGSKYRMGIVFNHLAATYYDRGKTRTNPKEAEIVAERVIEHARKSPKLSLGVVAFSTAQRQCIQDILELKRRKNPDTETFFIGNPKEPFFVKNLENVQGDERDVIFISIGYGRSEDGYMAMSFGPLNNEGGEKRLNVLITRSKLRCEIFTNITSEEIDLNRTKKFGIKVLKDFLYFAEHGKFNHTEETGLPEDSYFEQCVADRLTSLGYMVRKQIGSQGFYIDLAIVDPENPGRYILGIECDGAAYHSGRSARDRDRLRQQVLENIGWRIYRIWSTDWFRHPEQELNRLIDVIEKAKSLLITDDEAFEKEENNNEVQSDFVREKSEQILDEENFYKLAEVSPEIGQYELHLYPIGKLASCIVEIVDVESPVHFDEVARRVVEAAGVSKIGSRIRETLMQAVSHLKTNNRIFLKGDFLWKSDMNSPLIRNRVNLANSARKIKLIPPEEISLAIEKVVNDSIAIDQGDAAIFVAKMFGFNRVTEEMKNEILAIIEILIVDQRLIREGQLLKIYSLY